MTVQERLRQMAAALPSDTSWVALTRADIHQLLDDEGGAPARLATRDLTVEEVAEAMGRATSTVRGWLLSGDLEGYKLNNRDWRIPPDALRRYRERQGGKREQVEDEEAVDIGAWRKVTEGNQ